MKLLQKIHGMSAALAVLVSAGSASADSVDMGKFEFLNSCAPCHGALGKGDGPAAEMITGTKVPDLTQLQKLNGGAFPVGRLYTVIDGRADPAALGHGERVMPIWGNRYAMRAESDTESMMNNAEVNFYVQTRILSLIEYISTLQE